METKNRTGDYLCPSVSLLFLLCCSCCFNHCLSIFNFCFLFSFYNLNAERLLLDLWTLLEKKLPSWVSWLYSLHRSSRCSQGWNWFKTVDLLGGWKQKIKNKSICNCYEIEIFSNFLLFFFFFTLFSYFCYSFFLFIRRQKFLKNK